MTSVAEILTLSENYPIGNVVVAMLVLVVGTLLIYLVKANIDSSLRSKEEADKQRRATKKEKLDLLVTACGEIEAWMKKTPDTYLNRVSGGIEQSPINKIRDVVEAYFPSEFREELSVLKGAADSWHGYLQIFWVKYERQNQSIPPLALINEEYLGHCEKLLSAKEDFINAIGKMR